MRGKAEPCASRRFAIRITPAHAGKSAQNRGDGCKGEDHPRPCGEKVCPLEGTIEEAGITPAHAGKSDEISSLCERYGDHPRPCGEKSRLSGKALRDVGSPPPMRGKAPTVKASASVMRITPAHAGKSAHGDRGKAQARDHPRPCGEKKGAI